MDLLSILLRACHRAMLNISSQGIGNNTGLTSGKCATPCHVQRDRAPLKIIFLSQLSPFLIALVSLCALKQAFAAQGLASGIQKIPSHSLFNCIMVDWRSLPIANHDLHCRARYVSCNNAQPTRARWVHASIWRARDGERVSIFSQFRHKIHKA